MSAVNHDRDRFVPVCNEPLKIIEVCMASIEHLARTINVHRHPETISGSISIGTTGEGGSLLEHCGHSEKRGGLRSSQTMNPSPGLSFPDTIALTGCTALLSWMTVFTDRLSHHERERGGPCTLLCTHAAAGVVIHSELKPKSAIQYCRRYLY